VTVTAGGTATTSFALKRGVQVSAAGTSFSPEGVNITPGSTVRWVNNGGGAHTVTPNAGSPAGGWASASLPANEAFEHTFASAGTYPYHCIPHQGAGMTGNVVVSASAGQTPAPQPGTPGYP
jgi:plastocyanin